MYRLFEPYGEEPQRELEHRFRFVDGERGIKITCEEVSCIFEFIPYKFVGKDKYREKALIDNSRVVVLSRDPRGNLKTEVRDVAAKVGGMSAAVSGVATAVGGVAAAVDGVAAAMGVSEGAPAVSPAAGFIPVEPERDEHVSGANQLQTSQEIDSVVENQRLSSAHTADNDVSGEPEHHSNGQLESQEDKLHNGELLSPMHESENGTRTGIRCGGESEERVAKGVAAVRKTGAGSTVDIHIYRSEKPK